MAARRAERAPPFIDPPGYARHRPEHTLLYQIIEQHYAAFREARAAEGRPLPRHVQEEFEAYLKCGRLEEGFLRVRCEQCRAEKLVAFSCKKRALCPSCGARRMAETAALLVDEVLPRQPLRQWVLSVPFALRFLLATHPQALTDVLGIAYYTIARASAGEGRPHRQAGSSRRRHADPVLRLSFESQRSSPYARARRCLLARDESSALSLGRATYLGRALNAARAHRLTRRREARAARAHRARLRERLSRARSRRQRPDA